MPFKFLKYILIVELGKNIFILNETAVVLKILLFYINWTSWYRRISYQWPCNRDSPALPTRSALVLEVLYHQSKEEREHRFNRKLKVNNETDFKCFLRYTELCKVNFKSSFIDWHTLIAVLKHFLAIISLYVLYGEKILFHYL